MSSSISDFQSAKIQKKTVTAKHLQYFNWRLFKMNEVICHIHNKDALGVVIVPRHFLDSADNRRIDVAEVAIPQVKIQLLEAAAKLDPWMFPSHNAEDTLFIGSVLHNVFGVSKRKCYVVAWHSK